MGVARLGKQQKLPLLALPLFKTEVPLVYPTAETTETNTFWRATRIHTLADPGGQRVPSFCPLPATQHSPLSLPLSSPQLCPSATVFPYNRTYLSIPILAFSPHPLPPILSNLSSFSSLPGRVVFSPPLPSSYLKTTIHPPNTRDLFIPVRQPRYNHASLGIHNHPLSTLPLNSPQRQQSRLQLLRTAPTNGI